MIYKVCTESDLWINGKRLAPNQEIDLDSQDAKSLVKDGKIKPNKVRK